MMPEPECIYCKFENSELQSEVILKLAGAEDHRGTDP